MLIELVRIGVFAPTSFWTKPFQCRKITVVIRQHSLRSPQSGLPRGKHGETWGQTGRTPIIFSRSGNAKGQTHVIAEGGLRDPC